MGLFSKSARHKVSDSPAPMSSPQQLSTQQNVPVHSLCATCSNFFSRWTSLDIAFGKDPKAGRKWAFSVLTTVAHMRLQSICHICTLLLAEIGPPDVQHDKALKVFVSLDGTTAGLVLPARLAVAITSDDPMELVNQGRVSIYALSRFPLRPSQGFTEHHTAKSVPRYSRDNIARARSWIQTCCSTHNNCSDFQRRAIDPRQRPNRILEVTPKSAQLKCNVSRKNFDYVTLSHMWGEHPERQLRLLKENFKAFQTCVPYDQMSVIYKEAIRATCALGYKYIWIDSLCVIQKDEKDWKEEAPRMAGVYGNAVCNLAYLFPPNDTKVPKPRPDPRLRNPCVIRLASVSNPGICIRGITRQSRNDNWLAQEHWPLFSRGWTFQEYLLSPRTLIIGHENLMWQCSQIFYDELLGPQGSELATTASNPKVKDTFSKARYFPETLHTCANAHTFSDPFVLSFIEDWQQTMSEYRDRRLSNATDRAMAFAGVAQAYTRLSSMTYLAGCWFELLPLALLWHVGKDRIRSPAINGLGRVQYEDIKYGGLVKEKCQIPAPSWSTFSRSIDPEWRICHLLDRAIDEPFQRQLSALCNSNRDSARHTFDDIYWARPLGFQWPKVALNKLPSDHFSNFAGLRVTIEMRIAAIRPHPYGMIEAQFRAIQAASPLDRETNCVPNFFYFPDDPALENPPKKAVMGMLSEVQMTFPGRYHGVQRRLLGLMLVPDQTKSTFRRIGAWKLLLDVMHAGGTDQAKLDAAKRWKSFRIIDENLWRKEIVVLV